jgi:uncharacterized protein YjbI with pentapeptide repeats
MNLELLVSHFNVTPIRSENRTKMEVYVHRWVAVLYITILLFPGVEALGEVKDHRTIAAEVLEKCQGKFKDKDVNEDELAAVLRDHGAWLEAYPDDKNSQEAQSDPRKANLCGARLPKVSLSSANLIGADLSGANFLSKADLNGADLTEANLSGAQLHEANLSGAQLNNSNLSGAALINADLTGADLTEANLSGTYSYKTKMMKAVLSEANLKGAFLLEANLSGAFLLRANLSGATLTGADLSGAALYKANLNGAALNKTNLSGAVLTETDLSSAELSGTNMSGAMLTGANLKEAIFEPGELPGVDRIVHAENLSLMTFQNSPQALVKLRKAFKESGYQQQERAVTCAIKHAETLALLGQDSIVSIVEGVFLYVFFDLPTRWGMVPGRSLLIALILILVFAIPYVIALQRPGEDGIWRKPSVDRVRADVGTNGPERLHIGWPESLGTGLYFSLLSAFNIGWHELNVGNWIQRLQADEYTLRATGWVRTVSGVQSLINIYLVAIWGLTYFGRPFD